jgi:hypothetical protein
MYDPTLLATLLRPRLLERARRCPPMTIAERPSPERVWPHVGEAMLDIDVRRCRGA